MYYPMYTSSATTITSEYELTGSGSTDSIALGLGDNSMLGFKRLTACAANTFFYEDIG
jgi:hypothetical protein